MKALGGRGGFLAGPGRSVRFLLVRMTLASGDVSFEETTDAVWVIVGVGDEDGDVSRRDKVGATGALPKQIEGLGCRVGLYRCALHIAEAVTETIA